ncbi:hypothetical protein [Pedobacter sp. MR2016-24]|uniref:hypothetical protein n=1 Tax=Pedobacter sp. MR2016-24 TaxID=2994466 RepID=UPI002246DCA5|nr:hypothetical protein [Pedobacter sp. MR2016-24]MCX2482836.1 hypothetical protein [Pedobacter sp. MR2016-24]
MLKFLDGCEQSYNDIKLLRQSTNDEGAIQTLDEALNLVTYSKFINEDGSKNHFMVDHFLYDQSVRMIFQSVENFKNAYNNNYFKPNINSEFYQIPDADYKVARNGITMKDLVISIVNTIRKAKESPASYLIDNRDIILKEIQKCYPDIYDAYFILGEEELLKIAYSSKKIIAATNAKRIKENKSNFSFIYDLDEMFPDDFEATTDIYKSMLETGINKNDLNLRPTIKLLQEYFDLGPRTTLKSSPDKKGYKVIRAKFNRKKIRQ